MKIVFLGTPEFAVKALDTLVNSKHKVVAVVTQPDKPNARGNKIVPCAVKVYAENNNIPVYQFAKISRDGIDTLESLKPDLMITAAYGQILSQKVIDIPKFGIINLHASLLPKYRGASPIQSAVICGEKQTGITIMQTDIGLDTGDIIAQQSIDILENETAGELAERLSTLASNMLLEVLDQIESGTATKIKQNHADATFTKKILKTECYVNWNKSATQIKNLVLGANPDPIASTNSPNGILKIYSAKVASVPSQDCAVGTILDCSSAKAGVFVQTGNGVLLLGDVQLPGGKIMDAKMLMSGRKLSVGDILTQILVQEE